jgi:predicted NUDIX family NTP pyrophosphohydrolase
MPQRTSAGVLLYRRTDAGIEVLLVHPGGPFWQRRDDGAWTLPKGEFDAAHESPEAAARREFAEETGVTLAIALVPLTPVRQKGGKLVHPFAGEGDLDAAAVRSNTFTMEWPPRSGRLRAFPEVDRAAWFDQAAARRKILAAQQPILDELYARGMGSG